MSVPGKLVIRMSHNKNFEGYFLLIGDFKEVDITTEKMLRNVKICSVVHPYDHVVNSVIVAKVKSHKHDPSHGSGTCETHVSRYYLPQAR